MSSPQFPLSDRVALITGVSRFNGIGFAVARRLGRMGAKLFLHGWPEYDKQMEYVREDEELGQSLVDALRREGLTVDYVEHDFMDPEGPELVMRAAVKTYGHVDIVDANHACSIDDSLETLDAKQLDRHLLVNIRGTLMLVKAFAAQHDGRQGGRVFMMTSGQHMGISSADEISYMTSKAALHWLTGPLSTVLIDRGITVNTINPGPVDTGYATGDRWQSIHDRMPLGRWGQPDDVANVIGWLCTDAAQWITAQVVNSEGGFRRN